MDTSLTVRNMRRQAWALMLREQSASGLSVREWCRQNHLSVKAFYYRTGIWYDQPDSFQSCFLFCTASYDYGRGYDNLCQMHYSR